MKKLYSFLAVLFLISIPAAAQNNCNNALTINSSDQILTGGIPNKYLFTPIEDGIVTLQTCNLPSNQTWLAQVSVFEDCGSTEIQPSSDNACGNNQRKVLYKVKANERIRMELQTGIFGGDRLAFSFAPFSCDGAYQIECGVFYTGTNSDENNTYNVYGCPDATRTTSFAARDVLVKINKENSNDRLTVNLINERGFDLFLLEDCSTDHPICLQGRDVNGAESSYNWLIEPKNNSWKAGTYGVSIDAIGVNNVGNFGLIATCGRLVCEEAQKIECHIPINGNTANGQNNISAYRYQGEYQGMNTGKELLYYFTLQQSQTINITLDIEGNENLDLFLLDNCDEYDCLAKSTSLTNTTEQISHFLSAGTYYILVEGFNLSEGVFTLEVDADCNKREEATCDSRFFTGDVTSLQCEKFENYELGTISNQSSNWVTWEVGTRDHTISNSRSSCVIGDAVQSTGGQSLKVEGTIENGAEVLPDAVYLLGDRAIEGVYQLSWNMYIPAGKEAYFNIQKGGVDSFEGGGEFDLFFSPNPTIQLDFTPSVLLDYPPDQWFPVVLTFERLLDSIQLTIVVDGIPAKRTTYGDINTPLGGINFFATSANALYFVDCICLNQLQCNISILCTNCASACINGIDFTCLPCNIHGIDYNKVTIEDCFANEYGNAIEVSCGELLPEENLNGENIFENYACFDSEKNLAAKEKIYTFELTQTSDLTINAVPYGPNPNVELFLFSECLNDCVAQGKLTTLLEDNFEPYSAMQIAQTGLQPGTYYVVVDDQDSDRFTTAEDTYSISFNWDCGDLPRVCDLGGQFVNFGNKVEGTFGETDHRLLNLRGADCITNDLGGGIPEDYVFDVFVFYNDGDEGDTKLGISDLDDNLIETDRPLITHVFECDCRDLQEPQFNSSIIINEEECFQNCIDNDGNGSRNAIILEPKEGTFYYFIVAGPEGTDYEFDFVPNSLCERTGLGQTRIYGDTTLIGEEIPGGLGDFSNTGEQNIYTNCTSSSNQYLGIERLYELVIDRPVYVDITVTASTAMGMFLYHNDCGRDCKNTAELPASSEGGILSIVDTLLPGTYYLMVDSENPNGGTFDLTINTITKEEIFYVAQENCPKNEDQVHTVFIEGLNNTTIADNTYVIFHVDLGNNNHIPIINETGPLQWDANTGELTVELYHDFADNLACSYIENDTFLIKLKPEDNNGVQTNSVIVRGVYIDDPDDFGETNTFKIDGSSGIEDFEVSRITETLNLQVNGDCENFNSTGFPVDLTSNLDWYIEIPNGETWFSVSPMSGSNQERLNVTFNGFNSLPDTRTATFLVKSTTGIEREVTVCQKSSCANFLAAAGLDKTLECSQTGVELTANATGFPFLNNFSWRAISGSIQPGSFVQFAEESSVFVTEPGEYEVIISNNFGCKFTDTIKVSQNLPMINSETITDNSMEGVADGSIAVNIIGGTAPYTYTWNGQVGSSTINNIPEGQYELEVKDNEGCIINQIYTIEAMQETSTEEEEDSEEEEENSDSGGAESATCSTEAGADLEAGGVTEVYAYLYSTQPHGAVPNQFRYRPVGSTNWLETAIATTYYRLLSNLTAGTTYEFQIRHNCGNEDWSAYSDTSTFTTIGGSFTESPIQLKSSPIEALVKLYPNPAEKELNLISSIPFKERQQIKITNIWGQTLKIVPLSSGERRQLIDISNLTSGIYLLHWEAEKSIQTFKFIKD